MQFSKKWKIFKSFCDLWIVVASELDNTTIEIKRKDIELKYFCIPHDRKILLIPLLHHLFYEFLSQLILSIAKIYFLIIVKIKTNNNTLYFSAHGRSYPDRI